MKETMKEFSLASADSDKKKELEQKLNQLKQRLKEFLEKKKEITKAFAINKQRQLRYNSEHHSPAKPTHGKDFVGHSASEKPLNDKFVN